jgi:hypothetical protein
MILCLAVLLEGQSEEVDPAPKQTNTVILVMGIKPNLWEYNPPIQIVHLAWAAITSNLFFGSV